MFGLIRIHNEIVWIVVRFILVAMVHHFLRQKSASDLLFGNDTMPPDIASFIRVRVLRHVELDTSAALHGLPTLPVSRFLASLLGSPNSLACS